MDDVSAVVGLILRAVDPEIYLRFLHEGADDEEILEALFTNLPMEAPSLADIRAKIEGAVVAITKPRLPGDTGMFAELTSPLIRSHHRSRAEIEPNGGFTDEQGYSIDVISYATNVWSSLQLQDQRSELMEAMQFLELLLPESSSES